MPSRRPHTKTRHGCATCKARKVRCDEEKPASIHLASIAVNTKLRANSSAQICRNCTRGNRACRYPDQVLALPNALANASVEVQDQIFPIRDMDLLHHYTAITYLYVTNKEENYPIWQVHVPRMAFSHPFLLHGILAFTALHRHYEADTSQKENLMNLARYHQQHALTLYIPLLHSIDEENCHALFAFSIVLGVLCYSMLHEDTESTQSLTSRFTEVFDTLMGAAVVARSGESWLQQGELAPLMDPLEPDLRDFSVLEAGLRNSLEALLDCVDRTCREQDSPVGGISADKRREAYRDAVHGLATVMSPSVYENRQLSVVTSWPIIAGSEYLSLLRQRDPLAVVILGNYGIALHKLHARIWILEGLGRRLTEAVLREVDVSWFSFLSYAKVQVEQPNTPAQPK